MQERINGVLSQKYKFKRIHASLRAKVGRSLEYCEGEVVG